MCPCVVWLRPNQSTTDRNRAAFDALKTLYYQTTVLLSRGRKGGQNQWQMDHQKAMDAKKRSTETRQIHLCIGPMAERYIELLNWRTVGLRRGPSTSTTSPRSTSVRKHPADSDYAMKAYPTREVLIPINKQDHCVNDQIINHQQTLLSAFNELKAKLYLMFRRICEQDKITQCIPQSNNT